MERKRICPKCGKEIIYKKKSRYEKALINNSVCGNCNRYHKNESGGYNTSNQPKYSLSNLFNNSLISYYWVGFILADGSFYKNRFELSVASIDKEHLLRFQQYINGPNVVYRNKTKSYRLQFNNKYSIKEFMDKYRFNYNKTYNPVSNSFIDTLTIEQRTALLIGIIDGDGSIGYNGSINARVISITAHKNWTSFYTYLIPHWHIKEVNNTNCIDCKLFKRTEICKLLNFGIENQLPILLRKWKKI